MNYEGLTTSSMIFSNSAHLSNSIEAGRIAAAEAEAEERVLEFEEPDFIKSMKPFQKKFWLTLNNGLLEPFEFGEMQTKYVLEISSMKGQSEYVITTLECATREQVIDELKYLILPY